MLFLVLNQAVELIKNITQMDCNCSCISKHGSLDVTIWVLIKAVGSQLEVRKATTYIWYLEQKGKSERLFIAMSIL